MKRLLLRSRRRLVRYTLITVNIAILSSAILFINSNPSQGPRTAELSVQGQAYSPLDQISSADIAANVARMARLEEATHVANQADSFDAQLVVAAQDNASIAAKPQVVSTSLKSQQDIQKYTVKAGDTMASLADKFKITSDSIRWSNGLTSNNLSEGDTLLIPPVNGLVYVVGEDDTVESIARKFNAKKEHIIVDNDAEIAGLVEGEVILVRGGVKPVVRSTGYYSSGGFSFGNSAVYGYNGYYYGWCTWWAALRRAQVGKPVPANLGDAWTWASRARLAGIGTGSTPIQGAVIMTKSGAPGHVGFVEKVLEDGSIWVSDMNSSGFAEMDESSGRAGGWNRVSYRRVYPDQFHRFEFIY